MDKKVEIDLDDLMRVCNILDSLRVSLDQIGAVNLQGHDKMLKAMEEYFTPQVYREIADNCLTLVKVIRKELTEEEFSRRVNSKTIPPYQRKKY